MAKKMYTTLFTTCCLLFAAIGLGQTPAEKPQMADALRSSGKIYVVVAVLLVILLGVVLYLLRLDRKISKLEKDNNKLTG
jgi:hypothetical protein